MLVRQNGKQKTKIDQDLETKNKTVKVCCKMVDWVNFYSFSRQVYKRGTILSWGEEK